eukprot:Nk52_evm8s222 gene=Nk52_evmTU8s222
MTDSALNANPSTPGLQKKSLIGPDETEFNALAEDMERLLSNGKGEVQYNVGCGENGDEDGLLEDELHDAEATLGKLAAKSNADLVMLKDKAIENGKHTRTYLVRKKQEEKEFLEVKVAVVGNVDAGKSTLLGVLTHGDLDNGRGKSRKLLFKHKHEEDTGRTSCISHNILGFDSKGSVVNSPSSHDGKLNWPNICKKSAKVVEFIDLAGHEKYLKTTISGLTGQEPDYAMLMVGANSGIVGMTKEHLGLALAIKLPVFIVVTKIDMCPPNVLESTMKVLSKLLKSPGCRKVPMLVNDESNVVLTSSNFISERICPIFHISNVTGKNLNLLKMFINLLPPRKKGEEVTTNGEVEFRIDETYSVPGVGTVVSGSLMSGRVCVNDRLLLGPDSIGQFQNCVVKGIHRQRLVVPSVSAGQTATFALKKIKRSSIRKGMVLLGPSASPKSSRDFEAEILVLHHPTTMGRKYQAMVHCGSIRQTASLMDMSTDNLRTGDRALVKMRFACTPEYLKKGENEIHGNNVNLILEILQQQRRKILHNYDQ